MRQSIDRLSKQMGSREADIREQQQPSPVPADGWRDDVALHEGEAAALDATELICTLMKEQGVTRTQLADRLGVTKGWITQVLDSDRNVTVGTVAKVMAALGKRVRFTSEPLPPPPQEKGGEA